MKGFNTMLLTPGIMAIVAPGSTRGPFHLARQKWIPDRAALVRKDGGWTPAFAGMTDTQRWMTL